MSRTSIGGKNEDPMEGMEVAAQRLHEPPSAESRLSEAVPPIPPSPKCDRMVEVSLFHSKGSQIGDSRRLDTLQCTSFDEFKQRIGVGFDDVLQATKLPFNRIIYDHFVLFNDGENILDTGDGNSSKVIWDKFVSLLEAALDVEEKRGIVGSVEIIFD